MLRRVALLLTLSSAAAALDVPTANAAGPSAEPALLHDAFAAFKARYGKRYGGPREEAARLAAFSRAVLRARAMGDAYGVTPLADRTEAEWRSMAGLRRGHDHNAATATKALHANWSVVDTAPEPVDWVAKGAVSSVKDQGVCGSCWSFSAAGAIEGQHFLHTGQLVSLSEQMLMDCDTHSLDHGCHGGEPHLAMQWVINNTKHGGLAAESAVPYSGVPDPACPSIDGVATLRNYSFLSQNETEIAAQLAKIGPVSAGINQAGMEHYRGGVACPIADLCDPAGLNHAVLIVGWGVDDGQEYWKIKNSWGAAYGEGGYFRLCKGQGACGINKAVVAALG